MRVLLVEDEVRLADNLAAALRDGPGLRRLGCRWRGRDDAARNLCYDLVILDLMLPKLDGHSVLRRMRARKDSTPVLILTAKEGEEAIIELLNAGADDYLAKPFDLGELIARAKALIRRGKGAPTLLSMRRLELNTLEQTVRRGGSSSTSRPPSTTCSNTSCTIRARSSASRNSLSISTTTTGSITPT